MTENKCSKKRWEEPDAEGRVLDPGQFPELNAVFYSAEPSEFIKMRIENLALMACTDEALAPAYGSDRPVGDTLHYPATSVPHPTKRHKYVRMEAVTIVHHASEALLRLYFAHIDYPECPWLGMSTSTDFAGFKKQVGEALEKGFNLDDIAAVFLGGSDPEDAGIKMGKNKFKETAEALQRLLIECADRFLGDSFLYNAVKHGMTAIDTDAKLNWDWGNGKQIQMMDGFVHGYLHQKLHPKATKNDGQWFLSLADSNPERDLAVATVITYAIDSLWDVARRRYMGVPGKVYCIARATVDVAIYAPICQSDNPLHRITHELIKVKADGDTDGTDHQMHIYNIPPEFHLKNSVKRNQVRKVDLPVRPQDVHTPSSSPTSYLPIVPKGYQQGH
ncbi:hypothetical protein [Mycolicibacterium sp. S3B2]|uniref:hypothetical protein n=1 Tax=Mycolicibacterium sp. S3B2 TaxID=3415120 RepID=UPI003C7A7D86